MGFPMWAKHLTDLLECEQITLWVFFFSRIGYHNNVNKKEKMERVSRRLLFLLDLFIYILKLTWFLGTIINYSMHLKGLGMTDGEGGQFWIKFAWHHLCVLPNKHKKIRNAFFFEIQNIFFFSLVLIFI